MKLISHIYMQFGHKLNSYRVNNNSTLYSLHVCQAVNWIKPVNVGWRWVTVIKKRNEEESLIYLVASADLRVPQHVNMLLMCIDNGYCCSLRYQSKALNQLMWSCWDLSVSWNLRLCSAWPMNREPRTRSRKMMMKFQFYCNLKRVCQFYWVTTIVICSLLVKLN